MLLGAQQLRHVDRGRAGAAQSERGEHLGQRHRQPVGADRRHVRDLAGEPAVAAPDLPVADHRGADALAEVHVDEVARFAGAARRGPPS